jgi:D-glycero-alpha-D-manno-heptose-7-phosphate kinase
VIISRTPFRISFFGGGTDYPMWYREHGGAVLAATIDKYCYLTCRHLPPFFEHRYRVVYSFIENVMAIDEIRHPAAREVLRYVAMDRGVEIHHDGDLPARSGMGSSSAFTVGLLNALRALQGRMISKHQLAKEGIEVEQEILKETVGSQDQVMAAYGGLNHVTFRQSGEITVQPVIMPAARQAEFHSHLVLLYTGIRRTASDVAARYVGNLEGKRRQLRVLQDLVGEGLSLLCSTTDICEFGNLLHESWQMKRSLGEGVTNAEVDEIYQEARNAGALGGKLLGAGGGGFMLLLAPPAKQDAVKQRLGRLIHVPFHFDRNGSQIIFYDAETDYSAIEQARLGKPTVVFRELQWPEAAFGRRVENG